jgi:AraC-like DNA-binding protein
VREASSELVLRRPAPPLRPYIDSYVGYRQVGWEPGVHRGLPSRHLTFIVSIGPPIQVVAQTDPNQAPGTYDFVIGGLQARSALIAHDGNQEGVAIEAIPLGCRGLLGLPAQALWNTSIEAGDLLGRLAGELRERLHGTAGWDARFAVCDEVLGRLIGTGQPAGPALQAAWRLVVASGGTVPVADLAAEVGWSRRQLGRRFSDEFGLSPKLALRIVRFERARRMLQLPLRQPLSAVAAACGYYDQPHLNRDFVELAGCPPAEWLAAEVPSVQDAEPVAMASSAT